MAMGNGGALEGLRVIDLSRVLGGPYCGQMLADHGAEVIKVEPPQGDDTREWGPPFKDGLSSYFSGLNRNKRSIALDLGSPKGQEILFRLLKGADDETIVGAEDSTDVDVTVGAVEDTATATAAVGSEQ